MAQRQIFVAYTAEGTTDMRFLENVISKAIEHVVLTACANEYDVLPFELNTTKLGKDFPQYVLDAAKEAIEQCGPSLLVVHSDSDKDTYEERMEHKFIPAQNVLDKNEMRNEIILVPIIPIRMIEAWMLSDMDLLRQQLGTTLTPAQLGLSGAPESMADPKAKLESAIKIVTESSTHKKPANPPTIAELYESLGQQLSVEILEGQESFIKFEECIKDAFMKLGFIH